MKRIALLVAVTAALLISMTLGVAVAASFVCASFPCYGTQDADQIGEQDGSVNDRILGKRGGDVINAGRFGNDRDVVFGQSGNDKINVDDGDVDDVVHCGKGHRDRAVVDSGDRFADAEKGGCEIVLFTASR